MSEIINDSEDRTIFYIPAENLSKFEAACAKLSKKAAKLGCEEIKPFIFGHEMKKLEDGLEHRVYEVLFTAEAPKINGWTFVARLDHSNDTGNVIRMVPNALENLPERFRTSAPLCEHCRMQRRRRDTFVLHCKETNEFKQVGSTCLVDFFGHDPIKMARMAELLGYAYEAGRAAEEYDPITGADLRWVNVEGFLNLTAAAIRQYGWVSGKAAYEAGYTKTSTRDVAHSFMRERMTSVVTDADRAIAQEALMWALSFAEKDDKSDYEHNVLVVAEAEYIEHRSMGLAASIVGVYLRNRDQIAARKAEAEARKARGDAEAASVYVGAVGDKLKGVAATVTGIHTFEGAFGLTTVAKFLTTDGNVLTWFATKGLDAKIGDRVTVGGTVKKHEEYRGVKQTLLTRCKVAVS